MSLAYISLLVTLNSQGSHRLGRQTYLLDANLECDCCTE